MQLGNYIYYPDGRKLMTDSANSRYVNNKLEVLRRAWIWLPVRNQKCELKIQPCLLPPCSSKRLYKMLQKCDEANKRSRWTPGYKRCSSSCKMKKKKKKKTKQRNESTHFRHWEKNINHKLPSRIGAESSTGENFKAPLLLFIFLVSVLINHFNECNS